MSGPLSKLRFAVALRSLQMLEFATREMNDPERRWLAHKLLANRSRETTAPFLRTLNYCVLSGKNFDYDRNTNGEAALLERLAAFSPQIVFDVGANVGDWSLAALQRFPDVSLHAFELVPATCEELRRRAAGAGSLVINAFGLADREGEVEVYTHPVSSERSSTIRAAFTVGPSKLDASACSSTTARVRTGDVYMAEAGVERIDFLKIDVEGAELAVLSGFSRAFDTRAIDVVQFEYGAANLITRHFLQDFYAFFEQRGFVVGKLYPDGVAFGSYDYELEDFLGPIFVACRQDRRDIVAAIRRAS